VKVEISLQQIARALNGEIRGNQVAAPGPGHSAADRSLSVTISASGDDIVVHSFAGDDPVECKKYVRERCGLPSFKPNGNRHSDQDMTRLIQEAIASQHKEPRSKPVATYNYEDRDSTLLYQVLRYEPKTFRQRRPNGKGWIWKLEDRRVVYRWPELRRFPDATIFVTEGEKDADRLWSIDQCATTVAAGKWTDECVQALVGRDIIILQDNDDAGRTKAQEAAKLLHGIANTVRVVSLPGLPQRGDVSDWLDMGHSKGELIDTCFDAPLWEPQAEAAKPENKPTTNEPLAYRTHRDRTIHDWDDPDWSLLDTQRGSLPDFPLEVLSPKLQEVVRRTSKGAGVTHAHVAVPLLGISSGLIGYSRRLRATASWFQPATSWTALVGYSGTGKTPGHSVTRRAAKEVEQLRKKDEEKRKRDHETKKLAAKAARDNWEKKVKEATEAGVPPPDMPETAVDPGKYVPIRLIVNDGTIERLAELLQARPQGIVLVRDELAALFMNMSRYSGGQDDEFWLESWNGEPHTVERMGRMLSVDHLLIGVVGGMQPDKLVASFEGDHDGKYARVLFAWPDEPRWLGLNNDATEIDIDILNIISRILTLAEFTQDGRLVSHSIGLDSEAAAEFAQFAQFAHQENSAFEGREREWFAKATAHVLRLANTLTYVEWALTADATKPMAVNKTTMQASIRLVRDYFWPHARACLRLIGLTERHTNARRVLLWIRAKGKTEVSREEIRRDALSQRLDANETTALLTALSESGWLREEVTEPGPQGGKPAHRWLVNPKLLEDPVAQTALTAETPS
jgi:Protein of unknown function (DUF3987)